MKNRTSTAAAPLRLLPAKTADLEARAAKLWPDGEPSAEHNRREWTRAVGVVRATGGGWVVDRKAQRVSH
jgi:hypothetical protein